MMDKTGSLGKETHAMKINTLDIFIQSLRKRLVIPSLRFWIIIPLLILLGLLTVTLILTYWLTGQFPSTLLIISVISLVALIGPGLWLTRQLIGRIERIIHAAELVAGGDLTIRIDDESDDEIGRLVKAFNQMVNNLDRLHHHQDLLSRTLSPAVRQSLMERGLDFRGITQTVSVLFVDIRDFTRITEAHHSPEQLVFFLNDYYSTIASQVHGGGGIIGKYGGDSIMAYFGAPTPEAPAKTSVAALLTALALQDAMAILSERWQVLGLPPIQAGIGIAHGPVIAGPIGSAEQFEYTVIGDVVNLAARLQALTRNVSGYSIILSFETYEALEEKLKNQIQITTPQAYQALSGQDKIRRPIQLIDLGEVLVKGKKGPVHVYGVPDF
ncbi:MAG: HAMP domain-containing protein [Anaerolineales bacterium]|nr:HAMP domain-containing protein [Anaerolineales bacterium]